MTRSLRNAVVAVVARQIHAIGDAALTETGTAEITAIATDAMIPKKSADADLLVTATVALATEDARTTPQTAMASKKSTLSQLWQTATVARSSNNNSSSRSKRRIKYRCMRYQ